MFLGNNAIRTWGLVLHYLFHMGRILIVFGTFFRAFFVGFLLLIGYFRTGFNFFHHCHLVYHGVDPYCLFFVEDIAYGHLMGLFATLLRFNGLFFWLLDGGNIAFVARHHKGRVSWYFEVLFPLSYNGVFLYLFRSFIGRFFVRKVDGVGSVEHVNLSTHKHGVSTPLRLHRKGVSKCELSVVNIFL